MYVQVAHWRQHLVGLVPLAGMILRSLIKALPPASVGSLKPTLAGFDLREG